MKTPRLTAAGAVFVAIMMSSAAVHAAKPAGVTGTLLSGNAPAAFVVAIAYDPPGPGSIPGVYETGKCMVGGFPGTYYYYPAIDYTYITSTVPGTGGLWLNGAFVKSGATTFGWLSVYDNSGFFGPPLTWGNYSLK